MGKEIPPIKCFYRYEDRSVSGTPDEFDNYRASYVQVRLLKFEVISVTRKGAWIRYPMNQSGKKFILLNARKRFACETEEGAKESFLARKARQLRIYYARIRSIEEAIRRINGILC